MSRMTLKMKVKHLSGVLATALACAAFMSGGMSAMQAHAGEAGEAGKAASRKARLIRVVDLPDVPALHWRGGRYKDLGYLIDGNGEGTWVAYLGPDQHIPITQRELREMILIAAEARARMAVEPAGPQDKGAAAEGKEGKKDSDALPAAAGSMNGASPSAAQPTEGAKGGSRNGNPATEQSAALSKDGLVRDALDMALLPQDAERPLLTASVTRKEKAGSAGAQPVSTAKTSATALPSVKPASKARPPRPEAIKEKESGFGSLSMMTAAGAMLLGLFGGLGWFVMKRRKKAQGLRKRMQNLTQKPQDADSHPSMGPAGGEAQAESQAADAAGSTHHIFGQRAHADPQEALRAMRTAAQGGMT